MSTCYHHIAVKWSLGINIAEERKPLIWPSCDRIHVLRARKDQARKDLDKVWMNNKSQCSFKYKVKCNNCLGDCDVVAAPDSISSSLTDNLTQVCYRCLQ